MRVLCILMLGVFFSGCVTGPSWQTQPTDADDRRITGILDDLLNATSTTQQSVQEYARKEEKPPPTTLILTTSTVRQATSTSYKATTTTVKIDKTVECGKIEDPMGRSDCEVGYCALNNFTCGYLPGSIYRSARCVCMKKA